MFKKIKDYIKKNGWKAAAAIFVFYLIRDVSLYIILPWLIATKVL
tara:strand:+ start:263 stop:397 length:135 start_codon:yes stop_codon:yes gene_type:complete